MNDDVTLTDLSDTYFELLVCDETANRVRAAVEFLNVSVEDFVARAIERHVEETEKTMAALPKD